MTAAQQNQRLMLVWGACAVASGGALSSSDGGVSASSRIALGQYRVTLRDPVARDRCIITPEFPSSGVAVNATFDTSTIHTTGVFDVFLSDDTGADVDSAFRLLVTSW